MRERASALIIDKKKLLLVTGHNSDGYWTPGGRIEKGETPEECLKRELKEELNVKMIEAKFYDEYTKENSFSKEMQHTRCYLVKIDGKPKSSSEITEIQWVKRNYKLRTSQMFQDVIIAKLIRDELL